MIKMAKVTKAYQKRLAQDMRSKATKLYLFGHMTINDYEKIRQVTDKVMKKLM